MAAELTYQEVGATAGELPAGYHHVRATAVIGHGRPDLEVSAATLMTWEVQRRCGIRLVSVPPRVELGHDIEMRWFGQPLHCRVIEVIDEPLTRGFVYGTLPGHAERGEERFVVSLDPATGDVTATITAFAKPGSRLARLAGPVGRWIQQWMANRYVDALRPR